MKFKQIYISYLNLHKKQVFNFFLKKFLHKYLFKVPLWREIDNVTYYLLISSKNLKAVYLSFHWFNDSWTCGFELVARTFELVTRRFEFVTCGFELVTRVFELVTRGFELVTCTFELVTGGFDLVTRRLELVTCEFELVTREIELVTRGLELVTHGLELVTRVFGLALLNFNSCF